ncbi:hypothetical protein [Nostoc sp. UHCC 0251]|uniref:hypothetical protein n=1 Tax=Nostoc sp. UHCC 0251 TaxID=3110240 RepID=UPI002B203938|nr:hypothetical protein [Nostoc sp. UHCC 0251]MEA5628337.1 hypothetical protein [Nostoc sp. UHCC 0251]
MKNARLEEFRQVAYKYLGRAKDATFELTDAILLTRNIYSLADLSLSPIFRRKWPSIYEALQDSRPQRQKFFLLKTASIPADILVRLRSNLCLWGEPGAYSGKGCPRREQCDFVR